ncbi:unnamed protein product [Ilex paraguariensis]|uniref:Uncharacterized protein n=1 Tax=Ilex paraguariensis TaxID=185542 RepID=A0ABC8R884_9AQUA
MEEISPWIGGVGCRFCWMWVGYKIKGGAKAITIKENKVYTKQMVEDKGDELEEEEEEEEVGGEEEEPCEVHAKKKMYLVGGSGEQVSSAGGGGGGVARPCCQVEKCTIDLNDETLPPTP